MCLLIWHMACCIIDYFVREKGGYNLDNTLYLVRLMDTPISVPQLAGRITNYVRDHFANNFVGNDGAVHWQYAKPCSNLCKQRMFGPR